jgi:acyl-coenzyme A thioesterase PaaI-like protein
MDEQGIEALTDLSAATRELVRLVRTTTVGGDAMAHARALVEEAAGLLATATYDGPHAQTGHGEMDIEAYLRPAEFFPYSPVVGLLNPISPPVELVIGDDQVVRGTVTLTEPFNGPPWDYTHGGVVALLFDELLGISTMAGAGGGFTKSLTVRYHLPTPIGVPLRLEGRVTDVDGRKIVSKGTIHAGEDLTAEAEGLFISVGGTLGDHHADRDRAEKAAG